MNTITILPIQGGLFTLLFFPWFISLLSSVKVHESQPTRVWTHFHHAQILYFHYLQLLVVMSLLLTVASMLLQCYTVYRHSVNPLDRHICMFVNSHPKRVPMFDTRQVVFLNLAIFGGFFNYPRASPSSNGSKDIHIHYRVSYYTQVIPCSLMKVTANQSSGGRTVFVEVITMCNKEQKNNSP